MRERPILFSGPMVRAILDGRKTQTRRVIVPLTFADATADEMRRLLTCKLGEAGDRLWVRESWGTVRMHELGQHVYGGRRIPDRDYVTYRAGKLMGIPPKEGPHTPDRFTTEWRDDFAPDGGKWKPSIFMPRWASRLSLEITEVRVQRLKEISEADAKAEGVRWQSTVDGREFGYASDAMPRESVFPARLCFGRLWNSLNEKRGYGWDANPWVWAISFKPVKALAVATEGT